MFDLVYDFCVFVVRQLDPVLSIGAFYKLPISDIRPTDQPMGECNVCVFLRSYGYLGDSPVSPKSGI